jgi:hypothetical protein
MLVVIQVEHADDDRAGQPLLRIRGRDGIDR